MEISGIKTVLRTVELNDAEFICNLRNKSTNNKYLSSNKIITLNEQLNWIQNHLNQIDGNYFIIEEKQNKKKVGTISIYNILNNNGEFGRYICESPQQSIEAEFLLIKHAFENLKLDFVYCKTIRENEKTHKQHLKYGFKVSSEEYDINLKQTLVIQRINRLEYKEFNYDWIPNLLNKLK